MVSFENVTIGQHVDVLLRNTIYTGTVKYRGSLVTQEGVWVGLCMDEPVGSHNGLYKGRQYFNCPEGHGLFVRSDRLRFRPISRSLYNNYRPVKQRASAFDDISNIQGLRETSVDRRRPPCITPQYDEPARQSFSENFDKMGELRYHHKRHLIGKTKPAVPMVRGRSDYNSRPDTLRPATTEQRPHSSLGLSVDYKQEIVTPRWSEPKVYPRCICGKHNRVGWVKCACDTCGVKSRFRGKVDEIRSLQLDADLSGGDFIMSPSIPRIHQKPMSLGWDGYHYTREIAVP